MSIMTPTEQMVEKIAALEASLKESSPRMPTLLREIHGALRADEELVTTLDDEQLAVIFAGLSKQTGIVITTAAVKTKAKPKLGLTLDDL